MRHGKKFNHLGRKKSHRDAMLSNMACSLIEHKRINTTVAKAKALKLYVEPLITKSKNDTTHSRRTTFSYLKNKEAVSELFKEIAPKVANRPGGYTRIIRLGNRLGDNAEMCMIELVDFNELLLNASGDAGAKKTRRSRRGGGSKTTPAATSQATSDATEPQDTAVVENVVEEVKAPEETTKENEKKAQPEAEVKDEPAAEEKQEKENTPKAEEKKDENESSTESGEEEENKEEK